MKNILLISIFIFLFSGILYFYGSTNYVKNEFTKICSSEYSIEKDKKGYDICIRPYSDEQNTTLILMKISAASVLISLILMKFKK